MTNIKIEIASLLYIKDRKILMVKEWDHSYHGLPGGGIEEGETTEQTLKREVQEEIGVNIKSHKPYIECILPGRDVNADIKFHVFTAELLGEPTPQEEIENLKWVNSQDVENGLQVGNISRIKLIPELKKQDLID